jgi:glucose/arabinose dehydrogenase
MSRRTWKLIWLPPIAAAVLAVVGIGYCRWTGQLPRPFLALMLRRIVLPAGFYIEIYASGVPNARSMALGEHGTVFVGSRRAGNVYALVDSEHRNRADKVIILARGLDVPNGVAFHDGSLYVAEQTRVLRYDDIENHLDNPPSPAVLDVKFPVGPDHGWKFIGFGPDGWLYVAVGMPCNVCEPGDERYGTIMRMKPDGSQQEMFARGIRNSVGFDWQPATNELWFTDNGRDGMGDNVPPDELNRAPQKGMNFRFPYCHGSDVADPEFGRKHPCSEFVPPVLNLPAHVAALGMRFYTGNMFPPDYRGQIFVAEHGSWDRSTPIGYRISLVKLRGGRADYRVFAEGWLIGRLKWGRPVDVLVMPDGALLVSDNYAGAVYRIVSKGGNAADKK